MRTLVVAQVAADEIFWWLAVQVVLHALVPGLRTRYEFEPSPNPSPSPLKASPSPSPRPSPQVNPIDKDFKVKSCVQN